MTRTPPVTDEELLAYLDGVLSVEDFDHIQSRLAADPAYSATVAEWSRQTAALQALYQPVAKEQVPERLTRVIHLTEANAAMHPGVRIASGSRWQRVAAVVALLCVGTAAGWFAHAMLLAPGVAGNLASDAMQAHATYVVEVLHPVEVAASEQKQLETWLSKRLGHTIRPPDFAASGFVLMGGRVVPSDQGAAALFMYDNAQGQRITLYVAPQGASATTAFQFAKSGPIQSFYWMDRDLSYAVVGAIPRDDLRRVALAAYDQLI